jgi:hypothetical protein
MASSYLYILREKLIDYLSERYGKERSPKGAKEAISSLLPDNMGLAYISSLILFSQAASCSILLKDLRKMNDRRQAILSMKDHYVQNDPTFIEVYQNLNTDRPLLAFMVESTEENTDFGDGFIATIFPEEFPEMVARVILSPSDKAIPLKTQSPNGFIPVDLNKIKSGDHIDLLLRGVRDVLRPKTFKCSTERIISQPGIESAPDQEIINRLKRLHEGKIQCHEADVPLEMIKPNDPYFCLEYPSQNIRMFKNSIQNGKRPRLLVYWDENDFIMADDYGPYLAYRLLHVDPVPCVILGSFPPGLPWIGNSGGWDLLPPVPVKPLSPPLRETISREETDRHIEYRLQQIDQFDRRLNFLPILVETAARFIYLLQKSDIQEKEIHRFIHNHPELIDATASVALSEVPLGGDYRIDMVLQHKVGSVEHTTLVELENPRHKLFTKAGRLRASVTHAIQQVEDWIRWWREHPGSVPAPIAPEFPPSGVVVIGRSDGLTQNEESILEHLNANRIVKVLTYDMILTRYETMLRSISAAK